MEHGIRLPLQTVGHGNEEHVKKCIRIKNECSMEIRKNGGIIFYDNYYYGTLSLYEVTMMAPTSYRGRDRVLQELI